MKERTTAASRLHKVLTDLRGKPNNFPTRQALADVLGLNKDDLTALYRGLLSLQSLTDEIETNIRRLPSDQVDHELYLRSMPQIKRGLAVANWDGHWQNGLVHLTEKAVDDLVFCDNILSKFYPEQKIPDEELKAVKGEVDALFEIVREASIDRKLKQAVLDLLEAIHRSISEYQIRGTSGLREALAYSLGKLFLQYQEVHREKDNLDWKRVWALMVKIDQIVAKALEYKPLIEAVLPPLLGGPGAMT